MNHSFVLWSVKDVAFEDRPIPHGMFVSQTGIFGGDAYYWKRERIGGLIFLFGGLIVANWLEKFVLKSRLYSVMRARGPSLRLDLGWEMQRLVIGLPLSPVFHVDSKSLLTVIRFESYNNRLVATTIARASAISAQILSSPLRLPTMVLFVNIKLQNTTTAILSQITWIWKKQWWSSR